MAVVAVAVVIVIILILIFCPPLETGEMTWTSLMECRQCHKQTDRQTDIATYRLNQPRGKCSENVPRHQVFFFSICYLWICIECACVHAVAGVMTKCQLHRKKLFRQKSQKKLFHIPARQNCIHMQHSIPLHPLELVVVEMRGRWWWWR